jgi:uncharacterized membrane protein
VGGLSRTNATERLADPQRYAGLDSDDGQAVAPVDDSLRPATTTRYRTFLKTYTVVINVAIDVLYIGDNEQTTNHFFAGAESIQVYQRQTKDYEPLETALGDADEVDIEHMTAGEAIEEFPDTASGISAYDALMFSDLSRDSLLPHFLPDSVPGPNRVKLVKQFVEDGGGLVFCGGWTSFQGYRTHGNWHDSHVADVLPVEILPWADDRVDAPEGVDTSVVNPDHPVTAGLDTEGFPQVYGYNKTGEVKADAELLATVDGNTLLATNEYGDGRALAYTSDPSQKWGLDLLEWDDYQQFWVQALEWATGSN